MLLRIIAILLFAMAPALAHDKGQAEDPIVKQWYSTLMRPDMPFTHSTCCGEADAYWCVSFTKGGKTFCTIEDDRDDAPLMRPHIPSGTVVEIPNEKLKHDRGNPTGHEIVFMNAGKFVYCFVQSSGI